MNTDVDTIVFNATYTVCGVIRGEFSNTLEVTRRSNDPKDERYADIDIIEIRTDPWNNREEEYRILLTINSNLSPDEPTQLHCKVFAPELIHGEIWDAVNLRLSKTATALQAVLVVEKFDHDQLTTELKISVQKER